MRKALMGASAALFVGGAGYLAAMQADDAVEVINNLAADGGIGAGTTDGGIDQATGCPLGAFLCSDESCAPSPTLCP